jgi:hypothetical protein
MHLMHVVTFQNQLLIFIQGAIQNLTFSRGSRLITGSAPTDFTSIKKSLSMVAHWKFNQRQLPGRVEGERTIHVIS